MTLGIVFALGAAGVVLASSQSDAVIDACVHENGSVRIVDHPADCRRGERHVSWNQEGRQGPAGPQGPTGSTEVFLTDRPPDSEFYDAYIKFDGIDGESKDEGREDWSHFESFEQIRGGDTDPSRQAATSSELPKNILIVRKEIDTGTPKLAEAVCKGTIAKVEIHLTTTTTTGRVAYLAYKLANVQITNYQLSGSGQSSVYPLEVLTLNFEEINVAYTELDDHGRPIGTVESSWPNDDFETC